MVKDCLVKYLCSMSVSLVLQSISLQQKKTYNQKLLIVCLLHLNTSQLIQMKRILNSTSHHDKKKIQIYLTILSFVLIFYSAFCKVKLNKMKSFRTKLSPRSNGFLRYC